MNQEQRLVLLEHKMNDIDGNLRRIDESLRCIRNLLTGTDRPSLVVRVDRLEQRVEQNQWMGRALVVAVLGLAAKVVYELINPPSPQMMLVPQRTSALLFNLGYVLTLWWPWLSSRI